MDLRYFGVANQTVTSTFISALSLPDRPDQRADFGHDQRQDLCLHVPKLCRNFGNTLVIQTDFQDIVFGGAPFVDIGSPNGDYSQPGRANVGFNSFQDGLSNTMLAAEVIVGQGQTSGAFPGGATPRRLRRS